MIRALGIGLMLGILSGCTSFVADPSSRKLAEIREIPVGTDKAQVVRTYGAPQLIEIENKKFRYTYIQSGRRKKPARVSVLFDENNKVEAKSY